MNQFVPDWNNNMGDISRPLGEEDDLIELLWCNGHVVMQSQSNRKPPPRSEKPPPPPPPAAAPAPLAPHDDEAGLWFPYALADSLDRDIFSDFFCDAPAVADAGKVCRGVPVGEDGGGGARAAAVSEAPCELMPPPKATSCSRQQKTMSLADGGGGSLADGGGGDLSELAGTAADAGGASSSSIVSAMGSSICGSNQVLVPRAPPPPDTAHHGDGSAAPSAVWSANRNAIGGEASSSGRYSTGCFTTTTATTEPTTSASNRSSGKRKLLDTEDSESPTSEDAESESLMARHPPQKLTTARRSRAAEVHNLSERRRRDRINEKMRALQELIPHCNKADKASMLDEAIEYLKSLQMQVQMMWMAGGGMAAAAGTAVMFPGVHQYLPRMGMPLPSAVPRMPPFMAAAAAAQPAAIVPGTPVGPVPHHMPAVGLAAEPFAHFLGVNPHMQPATPQMFGQHYAQGVSYYPMGMKAAVQLQLQDPTLHVPDGVVPPESAPNAGPG